MTASFGGVATLPAADPQWGVQDAAGYWTGYSPYSAEEAAALAAKSAADRQAIADYEASIRAKAGPQELNTAGSFGIGSTNAAAAQQQQHQTQQTPSTTTQRDMSGVLPLLLLTSAFGGTQTVSTPQSAPVVGETSFSRDKERRFASGGSVQPNYLQSLSPEILQALRSGQNRMYLGTDKPIQPEDPADGFVRLPGNYYFTPRMETSYSGENNENTRQTGYYGGYFDPSDYTLNNKRPYGIYDMQGNLTGTGAWDQTDESSLEFFAPALLAMAAGIGASFLAPGATAATGTGELVNGAWLGEGVASGIPAWDAAAANAGLSLSAPAGIESLTTTSDYVNPKALLDGTNSFGANSIPNALDISALEAATTASGADAAVSEIAKNLGYTGSPASFGGSPTAPAPTTPTAPPAPAPTSFMDKLTGILNDPIKLLGLASILGGAGGINGGGSGSGGGGYSGGIPTLTASRSRVARDPNRRPGSAPQRHFTDIQYRAAGGLLRGPGTGMSDGIPALIDGVQPARLARDEYVMPADAVSALGDGSSEAGAEELDKLVARIRAAAHGKTDQQRRVNPKQVMPV